MRLHGPGPVCFASEIHNWKGIQQNEKETKNQTHKQKVKDILHASLELTSSEFVLLFTVCFLSLSVLLEAMQCRA